MKVRFFCDSGANIKSCRSEIIDTVADLGMAEGEWEGLDDEAKQKHAEEWAWDRLEIGYDEVDLREE